MYSYAGTIVQLLNQLRMEGYSNQEIVRVVKSYKFALVVFTGQFQRSGKSQIEHGVGTASMLCALGAPAAVVAAGVIHNIYRIGDYGDGQRGITDLRRKETIGHVGVEVENPLHGFHSLMESQKTITEMLDNLETFSEMDRQVLLIRLAEEFDNHWDLNWLYRDEVENCRNYLTENGPSMVTMAEKLGYPQLASELTRVFKESRTVDFSPEFLHQICLPEFLVSGPRSQG